MMRNQTPRVRLPVRRARPVGPVAVWAVMLPADFRSAAAAGAEMIVKVPEPVPAAQDLVDQQVDGFGGSVADPAGVKEGQGRRT